MSISSLTAGASGIPNYPSSATSGPAQFKKGISDLADALKSGNLSDAKDAFASLQQLLSSAPQPAQAGGAQGPLADDLAGIDKALKSNDLSAAQTAFKTLMQDLKAVKHGHHHHHAAEATASSVSDDDGDKDDVSSTKAGIDVSA